METLQKGYKNYMWKEEFVCKKNSDASKSNVLMIFHMKFVTTIAVWNFLLRIMVIIVGEIKANVSISDYHMKVSALISFVVRHHLRLLIVISHSVAIFFCQKYQTSKTTT